MCSAVAFEPARCARTCDPIAEVIAPSAFLAMVSLGVEVKGDVPVVAKTAAGLCSLSTWPPGLVLYSPDLAAVIPRAS